ncbi:MAG: acyl-CoA dehydrogenase family protein, partial [Sphingobium sp.]
LSKFQAVQHDLARLGGEVAAAGAAADMAVEALAGDPARATLPIAAAKARTGEAASIAVNIAQQLHGAIGFTQEHRLHWYTTALWSWRDEYGGQRYWTDLLGRAAIDAGGAGFWPILTEAA